MPVSATLIRAAAAIAGAVFGLALSVAHLMAAPAYWPISDANKLVFTELGFDYCDSGYKTTVDHYPIVSRSNNSGNLDLSSITFNGGNKSSLADDNKSSWFVIPVQSSTQGPAFVDDCNGGLGSIDHSDPSLPKVGDTLHIRFTGIQIGSDDDVVALEVTAVSDESLRDLNAPNGDGTVIFLSNKEISGEGDLTIPVSYEGDPLDTVRPNLAFQVINYSTHDISYRIVITNSSRTTTAPPNDNVADATPIKLNKTVAANNADATPEPGEHSHDPWHPDETNLHSLWWNYTHSGAAAHVAVDACGSDFDTVLAVYKRKTFKSFKRMAFNDDTLLCKKHQSYLAFQAQPGVTYHIAVDGWSGTTGNIKLHLKKAPSGPTTTTVKSSKNPAAPKRTVTFTVHVTGSTTVTGTVDLKIDQSRFYGYPLVNGTAKIKVLFPSAGTYKAAAIYNGETAAPSTSHSLTQHVK